jgi:hypothetical protein
MVPNSFAIKGRYLKAVNIPTLWTNFLPQQSLKTVGNIDANFFARYLLQFI